MRTAFVLAGGGSLGAVEVGMLEALVEADVGCDLVVGASVGAVNGAQFAGRPDAEGVRELRRIWSELDRSDIFPFSLGAVLGLFWRNYLVDPGRLRRLVERNVDYGDLDEAAIPFHVVATDVLAGAEVVLSDGPVVDAVLASSAIPGVFPPVKRDGRHLSDGGIASNTPVSAAVGLGAERIIVLPTGFPCQIAEPPDSSLAMALHALDLLIARQLVVDIERYRDQVELRVVPPLCPLDASPLDFSQAEPMMDAAAASTRAWLGAGGLDGYHLPSALRLHSHVGHAEHHSDC